MLSAEQRLAQITDLCRHPSTSGLTGQEIADAIILLAEPIPYELSDEDEPIPYELAHDAVYEELTDT